MRLRLIEKRTESEGVLSFIFDFQEPVTWIAGQYLTLAVPHDNPDSHGTEHYFTIASAPYEQRIQITTRMTGSTFKNALHSLSLGDTVEGRDIKGDFTLENPSGEYVFVAGGIGITPFRSILKQLEHDGKPIKARLLYGNRSDDAIFKKELEDMAGRNGGLTIHHLVSPEKISEETVRRYVPDLDSPAFYISGPEPMVEALEPVFKDRLGIPDERTRRDYFPGYDERNF